MSKIISSILTYILIVSHQIIQGCDGRKDNSSAATCTLKDIRLTCTTPFFYSAATGGTLEELKKAADKDPVGVRYKNIGGENALHLAAAFGHAHTVEALINHFGFDKDEITADSFTPLMLAAKGPSLLTSNENQDKKQAATITALLYSGADPDKKAYQLDDKKVSFRDLLPTYKPCIQNIFKEFEANRLAQGTTATAAANP